MASFQQQIQNERRKYLRRQKTLKEQIRNANNSSVRKSLGKQLAESFNKYRETYAKDYFGNKRTTEQREIALKNLQQFNVEKTYLTGTLARRNRMTERQVNLSQFRDSVTGNYGVNSRYSKTQIDNFYALTRNAWYGKDLANRNKYIMEYYGVYDLDALIMEITKMYEDLLERKRKELEAEGYTEEEIKNALPDDEAQKDISPPYLIGADFSISA